LMMKKQLQTCEGISTASEEEYFIDRFHIQSKGTQQNSKRVKITKEI
jgi:hypothetical protein